MKHLLLILSACLCALVGVTHAAEPAKPNILVILADDLGYGDLSCYNPNSAVKTPHLDRLAAGGVRFTDGYVTCPACAPSRLGLMSGAYQQRFGMVWNSDRSHTLPPQQKLLPELLRGAGYTTGLIGKWNIARKKEAVFDEIHDYVEWESDYFPDADGRYIGSGIESGPGVRSSKTNVWGPAKPGDEYLTDRMGRHAVEFIQRHSAQPFFLYLAFNAVHSPWNARKADLAKVAHLPHEVLRLYYAMVTALDENVGRVLDALDAAKLTENTLIIFLSDNGPANGGKWIEGWDPAWPKQLIVGSAAPLRGQKVEVLEGGIRVPFLLRWPARLPAGATFTQPVIACDVLPTACAAADIPVPASSITDGVNLLPHLVGEKSAPPHETLFWKTKADAALRRGNWKLVLQGANPAPQLYNLATDIGEAKNLATEKPDLTRELHAAWQAWNATLPAAAQPTKPKAKQP